MEVGPEAAVDVLAKAKNTFNRLLAAITMRCGQVIGKRHRRWGQALEAGWSVAPGVVAGARRHMIADGLGLAGARWGLAGAEAVLMIRTLVASGHLEVCWRFISPGSASLSIGAAIGTDMPYGLIASVAETSNTLSGSALGSAAPYDRVADLPCRFQFGRHPAQADVFRPPRLDDDLRQRLLVTGAIRVNRVRGSGFDQEVRSSICVGILTSAEGNSASA